MSGAPKLDLAQYKKNYGSGIPTWSPLYHESSPKTTSPNLVGGMLLPHSMRVVDTSAVTFGLDILNGKRGGEKLGWSATETAVGCRIRDYGSGVPHWSPLYGGSEWRKKEDATGGLRFKNFRTGQVTDRPTEEMVRRMKEEEEKGKMA